MSSGPWLKAEGLEMSYNTLKRRVEVLRGADLHAEEGEVVAVTGSSGSGKTTLLNLLGSLDRPTQFHHLLSDFSALENVMMPARIAGTALGEAQQRAMELLQRVGLHDRADHRPGELSGGEQQRVAVARALMNHPRLLLADEPAGNLDAERAAELTDLLLASRDEEHLAVVVVTHDERSAAKADRWLHLHEGRLERRR